MTARPFENLRRTEPDPPRPLFRDVRVWLVLAVALALFVPSWGYGFVYDDIYFIRDSPLLRLPLLDALSSLYTHENTATALFRPTALGLNWLEWRIGGGEPWIFHLVSTLVHVGATALFLALADGVFRGRRGLALAAGLVFAVHPVHSMCVAWISGRHDALVALFGLGALLLLRCERPIRAPWRLSAYPLLLLALLSKESGIAVAAMVVALDLAPAAPARWWSIVRERWRCYAALALTCALYFGFRYSVHGRFLPGTSDDYALPERIALVPITLGRSLESLLLPFRHVIWERIDAGSAPGGVDLAAALLVIAGFLALAFARRRDAAFRTGTLLMAAALLPIVNLVAVPTAYWFAEWRLYVPSIGAALVAGSLFGWAADALPAPSRPVVGLGVVNVALVLALALLARNPEWRDQRAFTAKLVAESPYSAPAHMDYALALWPRDKAGALLEVERAIDLRPDYPKAQYLLARLLLDRGDLTRALEVCRALVVVDPSAPSYVLLSGIHDRLGQYDEAATTAREALALDPDSVSAWLHLGLAQRRKRALPESLAAIDEAVRRAPGDADAHNSRGLTLLLMNRPAEAVDAFREAMRLRPDHTRAHANLVRALIAAGRHEEAEGEAASLEEEQKRRQSGAP